MQNVEMPPSQPSTKPHVLAVDDEMPILEAWKSVLENEYQITTCTHIRHAKSYLKQPQAAYAVVLLDLGLPDGDGLSLIEWLTKEYPQTSVIVLSGRKTVATVVEAIKKGAFDFLPKPLSDIHAAKELIRKAVIRNNAYRASHQTTPLAKDVDGNQRRLVGNSKLMSEVRSTIARLADASAPVLICGESGTGKELAARALHAQSTRHKQPFIPVNCAAISQSLIDSELFGHEKGAFTGALTAHKGLFEAAHGGTLFLDEIGDVPLSTQVRLLRVLQEGEIRPVGATQSRTIDVRVVTATNVDLESAMQQGHFREDLFYRLNTFRIDLPSLREHKQDIKEITEYILPILAARPLQVGEGVSTSVHTLLQQHHWPGNVRELKNALEYAWTLAKADASKGPVTINTEHLPPNLSLLNQVTAPANEMDIEGYSQQRAEVLQRFEADYLRSLLAQTDGNLSKAARQSGIDRSNLRRLLKKHGISASIFKQKAS